MLGAGKPYGSSTRWKIGTVLDEVEDKFITSLISFTIQQEEHYNHHTAKNVRRLIPWQNVWYLDWLFDDIQKGLK